MIMMMIRKQQTSFSLLHPFFLSFFPINDFEAPNHSLGTQLINEDSWISFVFFFFFFLLFFSELVLVHKPDFSEVAHQDITVLKLWESSASLSVLFLLITGLCDLSVHPRTVSARLHHTLIHNNYRSHMHLDFLEAAVESVANFCED